MQVAIDDFGTGYSSLSYLKEPPGRPAQDRPLLRRRPARVATRAWRSSPPRSSSHTASASQVVAEGVETEEQYDCLDELGCDLIQGYQICRPVSAAKLSKMIEAQTAGSALDKAA